MPIEAKTKRRYVVENRNHALWDRFRIWFYEVRIAVFRSPPRTYHLRVMVNPGDARYADAPFEQSIIFGSEIIRREPASAFESDVRYPLKEKVDRLVREGHSLEEAIELVLKLEKQ